MSARGASEAVAAKVRAMYGRRMTASDYEKMLGSDSVRDVISFLSTRPAYRKALAGVSADDPGRGRLEDAVRRARFSEFERLCRFGLIAGERLADWVICTAELGTLERAIYRITPGVTDSPETGSFTGSDFFDSHLSFDPVSVFAADDIGRIADAARDSRFYGVLSSFREGGNTVRLGAALRGEYWRGAISLFEDAGADEIAAMFRDRIDLENVVAAYRLKKYFSASGEAVAAAMIPGGNMKPRALRELADARDAESVLSAARGYPAAARLLSVLKECSVIDEAPARTVFRRSCRLIRYSSSPEAVMAAYWITSTAECDNIVKITEGKRYGVPPDEIKKMLILDTDVRGEATERWQS